MSRLLPLLLLSLPAQAEVIHIDYSGTVGWTYGASVATPFPGNGSGVAFTVPPGFAHRSPRAANVSAKAIEHRPSLLSHVVLPEPGTGWLVLGGLGSLALLRHLKKPV